MANSPANLLHPEHPLTLAGVALIFVAIGDALGVMAPSLLGLALLLPRGVEQVEEDGVLRQGMLLGLIPVDEMSLLGDEAEHGGV